MGDPPQLLHLSQQSHVRDSWSDYSALRDGDSPETTGPRRMGEPNVVQESDETEKSDGEEFAEPDGDEEEFDESFAATSLSGGHAEEVLAQNGEDAELSEFYDAEERRSPSPAPVEEAPDGVLEDGTISQVEVPKREAAFPEQVLPEEPQSVQVEKTEPGLVGSATVPLFDGQFSGDHDATSPPEVSPAQSDDEHKHQVDGEVLSEAATHEDEPTTHEHEESSLAVDPGHSGSDLAGSAHSTGLAGSAAQVKKLLQP